MPVSWYGSTEQCEMIHGFGFSRGSMERQKRFFYGWFVVAVGFLILFALWGVIINTFGVFLKPVSESMGWDRMTYSLLLGLGAMAMAVASPFVGKILDLFGVRKTMLIGAVSTGLGVALLGAAQTLWHFNVLFIFIGAGLGATTAVPVSLVIANWFVQKRGLAMGMAFMGTSMGGMVMNPVNTFLVERYGWRGAYVILGAGMILVSVPLIALVMKTRPSEMGLLPDGEQPAENNVQVLTGQTLNQAMTTWAFWFIAANMFLTNFMANAIGVHGIPYLTDIGHSARFAAVVIGLAMGFMTLGKVGLGWCGDRWGARQTFVVSAVITAMGVGVLMLAIPMWVALLFAVIFGFPQGGPLALTPMVTADCHGLRNFGAIYGVLTLISITGAAVGPVVVGRMYDVAEMNGVAKPYQTALIILIVMTFISAFCIYMARPKEES